MITPLVTIGVASFNNAPYLLETLNSIRDMDYPYLQIVVVDDASRDSSVDIINQWKQENPQLDITFFAHEVNRGICRVLNQVLEISEGEFFAYVGSDDILLPNRIRQQVEAFTRLDASYGVVYGDIAYMDSTGQPLPSPADLTDPHSGQVFMDILRVNFVAAMSALVRRSCFDRVGLYDESLSYEDWDIWLRLAREYQFLRVPGVVARYRIHQGSSTSRRRVQITEGSLQLLQKHWGYSPDADRLIAGHTRRLAETLYQLDSPEAHHWLWRGWRGAPDAKGFILWLLARLDIPVKRATQMKNILGKSSLATM